MTATLTDAQAAQPDFDKLRQALHDTLASGSVRFIPSRDEMRAFLALFEERAASAGNLEFWRGMSKLHAEGQDRERMARAAAEAERDALRAAADDPNQGLWRFWNDKAREQAATIDALRAERDAFEEILRVVCHHLEIPQSESGPCDDVRAYDKALSAADEYTKKADADLALNRKARFAAEADAARLRKALEPFAECEPMDVYENEDEDANGRYVLTVDDFHAARTALTTKGGDA